MRRNLRWIPAGLALAVLGSALSALVGAGPALAETTRPCDPSGSTSADAQIARDLNARLTGGMDGEMNAYRVSCARVIAATIRGRGLDRRAAQIAITTTIVESTIRNLTYGDRDSLGLFQQRPSQGWGTPDQILNPAYATNRFIDKMLRVDGDSWMTDPIGKVCQDVQVSAFPQRYYDATADGVAIANAVWTPVDEEEAPQGHSVTGDDFADMVGTKADGTMWLYTNNFVRDDGVPYSATRQIGSGWGGFDRIFAADVTGDRFTDMVATKPDGTMWLYSNNFVRDDGRPYSAVRQIGTGWENFDRIVGADVTGDGFADLVATKADGTMWLYSNNIVRDDGRPYSAVRQIGHGWENFDRLVGADVTGDGFADLLATKADGTMWLYSNNIVRDDGVPYSAVRQVGSGWGGFDRIVGADVTGDGFADLVATKADGTMLLYSNNIVRDGGRPYSAVRQIGHGWDGFDRLTA